MNITSSLHSIFKPIQPTITPTIDIDYHEIAPDPRLQKSIYCYWTLKSNSPLSTPYTYRVVSDGCIDLFFQTQHPEKSYVMGLSSTCTTFPLDKDFHYSGIRFLPGVFPILARLNAAELTSQTEELASIIPKVATFLQHHITPDLTEKDRINRFNSYFLNCFNILDQQIDLRLQNALFTIYKSRGNLKLQHHLNSEISARQLRRLFKIYIGEAPKTFSKIIRFQHTLGHITRSQNQQVWMGEGYYDQPHLIKDFKRFAGITPYALTQKR